MVTDLMNLQNGSDIRGVATSGVPGEAVNLDRDAARRIGYAFALWLRDRCGAKKRVMHSRGCDRTGTADTAYVEPEIAPCSGTRSDAANDPLQQKPCPLTVTIGRDVRISGPDLAAALAEGLTERGISVLDCGLASTPAMFMSTVFEEFQADGAIMITASHLPYNRNGFKFFGPAGGLEKQDITAILKTASALPDDFCASSVSSASGDSQASESADAELTPKGYCAGASSATEQSNANAVEVQNAATACTKDDRGASDLMQIYCEHLRNVIRVNACTAQNAHGSHALSKDAPNMHPSGCDGRSSLDSSVLSSVAVSQPDNVNRSDKDDALPLAGMKIVVDAGNGAGGFFKDVLEPLGAEVSGRFLEPDGMFPNHIPNPENKEAMESICSAVTRENADLGLIFDTDVDRSAAVDENGKEIARNGIVALAATLVSERYPQTTVVTDSITSRQLTDYLEGTLGMKHMRFKRGYRNVINKAIELDKAGEECHLAIETSGHAAIKENYFLDDGAYLAALIAVKAAQLKKEGRGLSSLLADLKEPGDAREVRMNLLTEDFQSAGDVILAETESWILGSGDFTLAEPNYEGVRADYSGGGWFLLRKSLHDPLMPLNIESDEEGGCDEIAKRLFAFLKRFDVLDTKPLAHTLEK